MTKTDRPKTRSGTQVRRRVHMVTTAYNDAELTELDEAASRAGLTRASFQRVQTLQTPPKTRSTRRAPIERQLLAKTLGQLGKIGSNLNQVARAAHIGRDELAELGAVLKELRAAGGEIMQALGRPQ